TPTVSTADKNGDENAEKRVASAVTIITSRNASALAPSTTLRSSVAPDASTTPTANATMAQGKGSTVRARGTRQATTAGTTTSTPEAVTTAPQLLPPCRDRMRSTVAASSAMKAANVKSVPAYFPTTYSARRMGRAKIGTIVFCSSSR